MSSYNARRAPNVSQYLADLNTVPSAQDAASQNDFNIDNDGLDFLASGGFFDFENFDNLGEFGSAPAVQDASPQSGGNGRSYQFAESQAYQPVNTSPGTLPPSPPNVLPGTYPAQPQSAFLQQPQVNAGDTRKAGVAGVATPADVEEAVRLAAEEDKRRRNTAASARFRIKKKQREQALEKQAKEMTEKVQTLEGRVQQLETENKWLRGLLTEKSDGKTPEFHPGKKVDKESDERSTESRTDGVGTGKLKEES